MSHSKKEIARAAVEAALMLFGDLSSSESDDDVEMLVMKAYLKYKAKRRRLGNRSYPMDDEQHIPSTQVITSGEDEPTCLEIQKVEEVAVTKSPRLIVDEQRERTNVNEEVDCPTEVPVVHHMSRLSSFVPNSLASKILSDHDFRSLFKLSRSSVEELVRTMKGIQGHRRPGRPMIPPEKAVLLFLWFLATRETYGVISDRFHIRKSVAHSTFALTCQSIAALKEQHIVWPSGDMAHIVSKGFEADESAHFPGVRGCLGATHIRVSEPKDSSFLNRAQYNSVILQAVCDSTGAFVDVFTGWPGSASHAHVWHHSPLHAELCNTPGFMPADVHLLACDAYPLSLNVMVPFEDTGMLTPAESHFNASLHLKTGILRRAFARLKHRFERLGFLHVRVVENVKYVTLAACVCHNMAVREAAEDDDEDVGDDEGMDIPRPYGEGWNAPEDEALGKRSRLALSIHQSEMGLQLQDCTEAV